MKLKIEKAIDILKSGGLVVISDDHDRENEGDLVGLQEFISPKEINFMIKYGRGLLCAPISEKIAFRHNLHLAEQKKSDGTNFTISIDGLDTTTGISSFERFETMRQLTQEKSISFRTPGHVFPLIAKKGGLSVRRGHTEASIDLAKLANSIEVAAIVEIVADNGEMIKWSELKKFVKKHSLIHISINELVEYIKKYKPSIFHKSEIEKYKISKISYLPTQFGKFNICVVKDQITNKDYPIVYLGRLNELNNSVARIHSACLTSESFHSQRCDCKEQLDFALSKIQKNKKGFVLYSQDEGRGIGIFDKINAYNLQDKGLDTVEANLELNHQSDERNFDIPGEILKYLGIEKVKLITNNPAKINGLKNSAIEVSKIDFWSENKFNRNYMHTKKKKMSHY